MGDALLVRAPETGKSVARRFFPWDPDMGADLPMAQVNQIPKSFRISQCVLMILFACANILGKSFILFPKLVFRISRFFLLFDPLTVISPEISGFFAKVKLYLPGNSSWYDFWDPSSSIRPSGSYKDQWMVLVYI